MKQINLIPLFVIVAWLISKNTSFAQDISVKKWHYVGDLYMMFPNMKGETTVASLPEVDVDADEAAILGNLKFGAMFYLEATNDDWAISSDFIYMKLNQGLETTNLIRSGSITMEQLAWEMDGLKHITPWLEVGLGGRLVSLSTGVDATGALNEVRSGSASKTWYDPVVVVRTQGAIKEKWLLQFRGDVGGFGVGSDFSWQIQANAGYRFSKLFQTTIGYRYISIDYDKGEGAQRFLYNIDTYGWVVHFGFNF
ncbi:MAG: hypothetical protein ABL895_09150 [Cyclobacteriaceae bacterium]